MKIQESLMRFAFPGFTAILFSFASPLLGNDVDNWPQWRGPTADGVASANAKSPLNWDSKTNIKWTANLPSERTATPIVWGDQVFIASAEKTDKKSPSPVSNDERAKTKPDEFYYRFVVTSIDRASGKTRWQRHALSSISDLNRHSTVIYGR